MLKWIWDILPLAVRVEYVALYNKIFAKKILKEIMDNPKLVEKIKKAYDKYYGEHKDGE